MRGRVDVERILRENLEAAKVALDSATIEFRAVMSDIPSAPPHPDGGIRVRLAGSSRRLATEDYQEALREFSDFFIHGIVPDRLIEK